LSLRSTATGTENEEQYCGREFRYPAVFDSLVVLSSTTHGGSNSNWVPQELDYQPFPDESATAQTPFEPE
jgi:hypothetical protein